MWVQSLGWEESLEEGMATQSCLENPTDRGAWRATDHSVCVLNHVRLFATPWTVACWALLSMEFSRQEYWSE